MYILPISKYQFLKFKFFSKMIFYLMSDFKNSSAVHGSTLQEKDCDTNYDQKPKNKTILQAYHKFQDITLVVISDEFHIK